MPPPRVTRRIVSSEPGFALLDQVTDRAEIVEPAIPLEVVRDPDDDRVVEAAFAGAVDALVSGDRDLLDSGDYAGGPIVTAAQFLVLLEEQAAFDL